MRPNILKSSAHLGMLALCAIVVVALSQSATANVLCVNPGGSHGCFSKIQMAVNAAGTNDIINVEAGT